MKTNNYLLTLASALLLTNTPVTSANPLTTPPASGISTTPPAIHKPAVKAEVSRTAFTRQIVNREPVDQLTTAQTGQVINYFSELKGLQGHVITHRWEHNGQFKLGMQFPVNGQRWRVHSSKTLHKNTAGTWTVSVINDDGTLLKQDTLVVSDTENHSGQTEKHNTPAPAPVSSVKQAPAKPVMPELPEVQPPAEPTPPSSDKTGTTRKPIWEVLPQ